LVTGTAFSEGLNVKPNIQKAIAVLRALSDVDPGYTVALCDLLSKSGSESDRREAFTRCVDIKEKDFRAMALLSRMFIGGIGTEKNPTLALVWADSADLEHQKPTEMFDILWKIGTPETYERLLSTISPAAESGDLAAIGRLAKIYYEGKGAEKDLARAAEILRPISKAGSWPNLMFDILWDMDSEDTYEEMFTVARNAVDKGDERAVCRLARCYRDGKGVEKDLATALSLMEKAADADRSLIPELKALKKRVN
ncbi:MAG: sel1 repeat family protein, partial [archaeon]|nr:sel1 repeat family protein [archaeon]